MQNVTLKIGTRIGRELFQIERKVEIPSVWGEVAVMPIPDDVKLACFNRAWRIRLQENSGAREYLSGLTAEQRKAENLPAILAEVDKILAEYVKDPTSAKAGRPPKTVEITDNETVESLTAKLAAAGVKITLVK